MVISDQRLTWKCDDAYSSETIREGVVGSSSDYIYEWIGFGVAAIEVVSG